MHVLWKDLARRVAPTVAAWPEWHTLLPLPGRVVVPGSRFQEVYCWDSYWVGSQPPLLSSMVSDIYTAIGDWGFVRKAFPSLLKEHSFWMSDGTRHSGLF